MPKSIGVTSGRRLARHRRSVVFRSFLGLLATLALSACSGDRVEDAADPLSEVAPTAAEPDRTPEIISARLTPDEPAPGELVTLNFEVPDSRAGDLIEFFVWKWNGRRLDSDGPQLWVPEAARRGDRIEVELRVQNATSVSDPIRREATVTNTPEEWIGLEIRPDGEVESGTPLVATPEVVDHDGDPVEFKYTWKLNGDVQETKSKQFSTTDLRRGDEISVSVYASDGESFGSTRETGPVKIMNSDPKITSTPPQFSADGSLHYEVEARDPDGDRRFVYSLDRSPERMQIDRVTGVLSWSPNQDDVGVHGVEIRIDDRHGGFALQHFELTVGTAPIETAPASR